jgi:hypothetical protein
MTHFRITVLNRGDDRTVGDYAADQVPAVGDLIYMAPQGWSKDDLLRYSWYTWRVDQVIWNVVTPGSPAWLEWMRSNPMNRSDGGYCQNVDVLVWPAQGPHWANRAPWSTPDENDKDAEVTNTDE